MSSPRKRTCTHCHLTYDATTYSVHRTDPIHRTALAARVVITEQSESWAALEAAGTPRTAIAAQVGVSRQYVSQVLLKSGRRAYRTRKKALCFICDESYVNTWADHQAESEHQLRSQMLVERLEGLSKGEIA